MKNPPLIRLTRQFRFEAAHALWGHDGACRSIHGHSYLLEVTVAGHPEANPAHPKSGMVIDFSKLKDIVHNQVIHPFDHGLLMQEDAPFVKEMNDRQQVFGKLILLPYQPTCENMLSDIAERLQKALPEEVSLHSLKLHETGTSCAEWHASDNP